jgi:hypothetical protein
LSGVTKVVVDPEKFVLPSPLWGFDSGNRNRIERDPALCELHIGDVGILYGWLNFGKKSCVFVSLILIYFLFLFKICSCLELELTLDLNPRV